MAVLFTILLGASALLLAFFLYDYGQKNFLRETIFEKKKDKKKTKKKKKKKKKTKKRQK